VIGWGLAPVLDARQETFILTMELHWAVKTWQECTSQNTVMWPYWTSGREHILRQFVASQVQASDVPRILGRQGQRRHYRSCFCLFWAVPSGCLASFVWHELTHVFVCNYLRSKCLLHLGTSSNSPCLWSQPSIRKFPEFRSVRWRVLIFWDVTPFSPIEVHWNLLNFYTGSLWRRQSQQSFNILTPFNFLFYSLHISPL
jgi:hypothetical protein